LIVDRLSQHAQIHGCCYICFQAQRDKPVKMKEDADESRAR